VDEWRRGDRQPHGVSLPFSFRDGLRDSEPRWIAKLYLGGAQRVIARGTFYQCARLYDAALVFFAEYRTKRAVQFNFDEELARLSCSDSVFIEYFRALLALVQRDLTTADQRVEHSRLRTLDRQHDTRTATGRIEARLTSIEQAGKLRDDTLARIETRLNTLAAQLALLHSLPAVVAPSAEVLCDAKNNLTPITPVLSCNP
jgi:hypothetical protein